MTFPDDCPNEELVRFIAAGDQQAFEELFDRLSGDVFKLCYSLLLNRQAAEDATQDTFIKLWRNAENWKPDATAKTWIMTIARNRCFDILRKRKNDLKKHQDYFADHLSSVSSQKQENALDSQIDHRKHRETIKNILFTLPERQREAITLVYYTEVHNHEAARIMEMQASAFDSLLARARRNLRDKLGHKGETLKGELINGTD